MMFVLLNEVSTGDIIEYYVPNSIAGSAGSLARATVLGVKPEDEHPLILNTPHLLELDHHIKLVAKDPSNTRCYFYNSMDAYHLVPGGHFRHGHAVMCAAGAFSRKYNKKKRKLQETARANGFAPMDVLVTLKGGTDGDVSDTSSK